MCFTYIFASNSSVFKSNVMSIVYLVLLSCMWPCIETDFLDTFLGQ